MSWHEMGLKWKVLAGLLVLWRVIRVLSTCRIHRDVCEQLKPLAVRNVVLRTGEMTQWVRALVALLENQSSVPSTQVVEHNDL